MKELQYCIYCGKTATTREHVPPKCFLGKPYPKNLFTLPACKTCNNGFSEDEQYLLYLSDYIRSIENGSGDFTREKARLAFEHSDKIEDRMINSLKVGEGKIYFEFEVNRIQKIIEKTAYGLIFARHGGKAKISKSSFVPLTLLNEEQKSEYEQLRWVIIQENRFKYTIQNPLIYFVINEVFLCVASYSL